MIAVQLTLAVVYPEAGNLGGGGFLIARKRDGKLVALDYREMAPAQQQKICTSIKMAMRRMNYQKAGIYHRVSLELWPVF